MSVLKTKFAAQSAKTLRANSTDAERKLWSSLRSRQVLGHKFVRQQPVGPYIADFAYRVADLIIELDGGQHAESDRDAARTAALAQHGYTVIRFWNNDVLTNLDGVLESIAEHLNKAPSPGLRFAKPDLSPEGRGEAVLNPDITGNFP
ncbi:very-short-patch-repair endonuclease [Devosia sp. UYZn731]|uniref:endonuclease domain-containing protein n=1 Tax=Devosia sp. UYZn731 TaxID=3156345 RepID=UPI003392F4E8